MKMNDNVQTRSQCHLGPLGDPIIPAHLLCMADSVKNLEDYAALVDDLATLLRHEHRAVWRSEEVAEIVRLLCVAVALQRDIDDWAHGSRRLVAAVCGPARSAS